MGSRVFSSVLLFCAFRGFQSTNLAVDWSLLEDSSKVFFDGDLRKMYSHFHHQLHISVGMIEAEQTSSVHSVCVRACVCLSDCLSGWQTGWLAGFSSMVCPSVYVHKIQQTMNVLKAILSLRGMVWSTHRSRYSRHIQKSALLNMKIVSFFFHVCRTLHNELVSKGEYFPPTDIRCDESVAVPTHLNYSSQNILQTFVSIVTELQCL